MSSTRGPRSLHSLTWRMSPLGSVPRHWMLEGTGGWKVNAAALRLEEVMTNRRNWTRCAVKAELAARARYAVKVERKVRAGHIAKVEHTRTRQRAKCIKSGVGQGVRVKGRATAMNNLEPGTSRASSMQCPQCGERPNMPSLKKK